MGRNLKAIAILGFVTWVCAGGARAQSEPDAPDEAAPAEGAGAEAAPEGTPETDRDSKPAPLTFDEPADEDDAPREEPSLESLTLPPEDGAPAAEAPFEYYPPAGEAFMGDSAARWAQMGVGLCVSATCCGSTGTVGGLLAAVAFFLPWVGTLSSVTILGCSGCGSALFAPAAGTTAGVFLREWLGPARGVWGYPCLVSYGAEALAALAIVGSAALGALLTAPFFVSIPNPEAQPFDVLTWFRPLEAWNWASLGAGGALAVGGFSLGLLAAIFVPPVASTFTYGALAEPKASDDHDFRFPGWSEPNHLTDEEREQRRLDAIEEHERELEREREREEREKEKQKRESGIVPAAYAY